MSFETEFMIEKWMQQANELEEDFDKFRGYFAEYKKCTCHIDDCKHFDKALSKVLGNRASKICRAKFDISLRAYYDSR